jgi:hypothetical protein
MIDGSSSFAGQRSHWTQDASLKQLLNYFLNPSHLPVHQPNLDAVGVMGRFCQNIFDHPPGQPARALIFFQNYINR